MSMSHMALVAAFLLPAAATAQPAKAPPYCMMRATASVTAIENPHAVVTADTTWGPATQLRVDRKTGATSLCAHGDYCYPAAALRFVTPCSIATLPMAPATPGDGEWLYPLDPR